MKPACIQAEEKMQSRQSQTDKSDGMHKESENCYRLAEHWGKIPINRLKLQVEWDGNNCQGHTDSLGDLLTGHFRHQLVTGFSCWPPPLCVCHINIFKHEQLIPKARNHRQHSMMSSENTQPGVNATGRLTLLTHKIQVWHFTPTSFILYVNEEMYPS